MYLTQRLPQTELRVNTGNLRVGTGGTPDLTLDGEDSYFEGTFEVDGASRLDSTVDINGATSIDAATATALTIGDGTNTYLTFDGTTDAGDTLFSISGASSGITSGTILGVTADTITTGTGF